MASLCIKRVGGQFHCLDCESKLIKYGFTKAGKQRYRCKQCNITTIEEYSYCAYNQKINSQIVALTKEGVGIRSTARLLKIAVNTVLSRIIKIADGIRPPVISYHKTYEIDELCTFLKRKTNRVWIVCAYCRESKSVMSFNVGKRTNKTLKRVIETVQNAKPIKIFTDKLKNYQYPVNKCVHSTNFRGTNHIERMNLTLRTHLKRLNRRTITFSRSMIMLIAILKIYFWS